jgi:hypothetical protein
MAPSKNFKNRVERSDSIKRGNKRTQERKQPDTEEASMRTKKD